MRRSLAVLVALVTMGCVGVRAQADTSPHTEHFIQVNGITLQYLDWGGTGEPLVLLTGYGAAPHVFDGLAARFIGTFRVVGLTRRGRAPSDRPSSGYDLDTLASDVKGVLDVLRFDRAHLVAHSFGGSEATHLAMRYPDRVVSVVYLDAALDAAASEAVMKEAPASNPQPAPGTPYAQVLQWWTSYSPDFSKVRCPTLAFFALQDNPPIPPSADEQLRQRATTYWRTKWLPMMAQTIEKFRRETSGQRAVVFENTSHYLFQDREAEVVREMNAFYSTLRARR